MSNDIINSPTIWLKPNDGMYRCNIDVSFSNIFYCVDIGTSSRDDGGKFVLAKT